MELVVIETTTYRMQSDRSTTELKPLYSSGSPRPQGSGLRASPGLTSTQLSSSPPPNASPADGSAAACSSCSRSSAAAASTSFLQWQGMGQQHSTSSVFRQLTVGVCQTWHSAAVLAQ